MIDLHVHSKYSLLDSIIDPEDLVKMSKDMGRSAVCVTEHGNLYSSIETYKLCQEYGLKYIMGCEVYICDDVNIKDKNNRYNHLVLLAKNEIGRLNLIELVSNSNKYKYYGKPRIDFDMLKEHGDGLIVLSACLGSEIAKALTKEDVSLAESIALKYKKTFKGDYYLEYQSHEDELQQKVSRLTVDLANKLDIEYVVTTDSHYLKEEDQKYHDIFVQIGTARDAGEIYNNCCIQSDEQVLKICKSTTREENLKAIANTYAIADKCNVKIPLSDPIMPHVDIPNGFDNELKYLQYLCAKGWHDRDIDRFSLEKQQEYKDRLNYEMDVISKMGFIGYFLLVESYITTVKRRGIARGSAGGSLIAYLTHIIDIDPIEFDLYFERFLDVGSLDLLEAGKITKRQLKIPDIDSDVSPGDREFIVEAISNKYGNDRVASLGVFQYMRAKGAIKDIGRVLGVPYEETNKMTKPLGDLTIEEALSVGMLDKYTSKYPELFKYAKRLAGLPKSFGSHACGFIIGMDDIKYYNAIELDDNGNYVLQGDMHTADDLGLVKVDILGLRTVDVIYDTLEMIGEDYEYIAPHKINFNDKRVLEQFRLGNTSTVFQFESSGMQSTLQSMEANSIDDLIAANALFRPGSMDFIGDYADRKRGLVDFEYLHPDLESVLESTYGIIVFQEQLIEIGKIAKLSNPDSLRKATSKKSESLMNKIYPELKKGLMDRCWSEEQVEELWGIMLDFAKYSFNKSHSAAYAVIAYISMFLKVYHPKEYMTAAINSYNGKMDKISVCIEELKRLGIKIEVPSWRNITSKTVVRDRIVYTGTETIKYLNANLANELHKLSNNTYSSLFDFLMDLSKTEVTDKHIEILSKLGCFSEFGNPNKILEAKELIKYLPRKQITKSKIDKTPFTLEELKKYGKETDKQIRDIDFKQLVINGISNIKNKDENVVNKAKTEIEYLGYAKSTLQSIDPSIGIVSNLEQNQWGTTFIDLYRINNGEVDKLKITKAVYIDNPIHEMDIIKTITIESTHKKRKVDGKWVELDEKENILIKWARVVA